MEFEQFVHSSSRVIVLMCMVSPFFEPFAGAPRPIVRRDMETEPTWWVSRFDARMGRKAVPNFFRDSVEPGPGTIAIVIGELGAAHAQALSRCLSAGRRFQKLLTSAGPDTKV